MSILLLSLAAVAIGGLILYSRVAGLFPRYASLSVHRTALLTAPPALCRRPKDCLPRVSARPGAPAVGTVTVSGLNKTEAEELLDWLEVNGHRDCELSHQADTGFVIRYR
jgi:hypothetical protein